MKIQNDTKTGIWASFIIISLIMVPVIAFAQMECPPNAFDGAVTVNGVPAPDGLIVVARHGITDLASTTTLNGYYGLEPFVFIVPDPDDDCENSNLIDFYVQGQFAGQTTFRNLGVTHFNLSATGVVYCGDGTCSSGEDCSSCPEDCGACSTGGGTGGGGGSSGGGGSTVTSAPSSPTPEPAECTPNWVCSPWSQCINFTQSRECLDTKECGTDSGKPSEEQSCGVVETYEGPCEEEGKKGCKDNNVMECRDGVWIVAETCSYECAGGSCVQPAGITGLFLNPAAWYVGLLIVMVILGGLAYWKFR